MNFRPLFLAGLLIGPALAQVAPPAPDTRATPPPPPTPPTLPAAPTISELLTRFPGRWEGEQRVISPAKTVMVVRVTETYRLDFEGKRPVLLGDIRYTIGTGDTAKTFRGTSRTWVDEQGLGHAEVTQDGKTEKYAAQARADSLVFLPAGHDNKPTSGTGVRVVTENGAKRMVVKGFQQTPKGLFIIEGLLKETPLTPEPAASR